MPDLLHPVSGMLGLLTLALLVVKVWALIDCATRPTAAFVAHGKLTKVVWLVILIAAVLTNGIFGLLALAGTVAAIVYLADVRPAVRGS